jgi:hypothetical protein
MKKMIIFAFAVLYIAATGVQAQVSVSTPDQIKTISKALLKNKAYGDGVEVLYFKKGLFGRRPVLAPYTKIDGESCNTVSATALKGKEGYFILLSEKRQGKTVKTYFINEKGELAYVIDTTVSPWRFTKDESKESLAIVKDALEKLKFQKPI